MPLSAKELRELRMEPARKIRQLADTLNDGDIRSFTAEEREQYEAATKDYNDLTQMIDVAERAETVTAALEIPAGNQALAVPPSAAGVPVVDEKTRALAMQAWLGFDEFGVSEEQANACRLVGLNPKRRTLQVNLLPTSQLQQLQATFNGSHPQTRQAELANFRADLSGTTGASGGYLVAPEMLVRNLEINMLAFGGMRQVSEIMRTNTGERMSWPTADDTSNTGEQLGEAASVGSSVDPSFAKIYWDAYKFSSKLIKVPYELIEDSVFNLAVVLGNMLGERLGRITNTKYTTGTGAATPKGITVAATLGVTAASATDIAPDEVFDLVHSVDPAYRAGARFMFHDLILKHLRLKKDGEGRYLWQSGLNTGAPDTLVGYPLTVNQDMASTVASTNITMLFGQLFRYKIRSVGATRFKRLDERYADNDEVAFLALIREDGNLLDSGTAPVKYLQQ